MKTRHGSTGGGFNIAGLRRTCSSKSSPTRLRSSGWRPVSVCGTRIGQFRSSSVPPPRDAIHLYFVHSDELVVIVGIWGATRRTTPRFADRVASTKAALAATDRATTTPGFVNRNGQEVEPGSLLRCAIRSHSRTPNSERQVSNSTVSDHGMLRIRSRALPSSRSLRCEHRPRMVRLLRRPQPRRSGGRG